MPGETPMGLANYFTAVKEVPENIKSKYYAHTHLNVKDFLKIKLPVRTYALPAISIERCFSINDPKEIPFENLNKHTLPPRHASNIVVRYQGFGTRFCDKPLMSHPFSASISCLHLHFYVMWALRHHRSKEDLNYLERTLSFSSDSKLSWRRFPMPLKPSRNERNRRILEPAQMKKTVMMIWRVSDFLKRSPTFCCCKLLSRRC